MTAELKMRGTLSMASRVLAAVAGGYAFVSLLTLALSLCLPLIGVPQGHAVVATSTASFLVYGAVVMAVFHARSSARAWVWLAVAVTPLAVAVAFLLPGAAS